MSEPKLYRYDTHVHTSEVSKCARSSGREMAETYRKLGYDGIIITDHFFRGNTRPDRNLPWPEYIDEYCRGYEEAKDEGDKLGFKVFFGWEECFRPDEYLVYGLDKDWLKAHPEMTAWDHKTYYEQIRKAGGCVVGAHPFRERGYVTQVNLHPFQCDAMEACNFGNPPWQDVLAYNFCRDRGILMTSGSDMHDVNVLESTPCGMLFDEPLNSIGDFVNCILTGKGFTPMIPDDRRELTPEISNTLPMFLYDENNVGRSVEMKDLFIL